MEETGHGEDTIDIAHVGKTNAPPADTFLPPIDASLNLTRRLARCAETEEKETAETESERLLIPTSTLFSAAVAARQVRIPRGDDTFSTPPGSLFRSNWRVVRAVCQSQRELATAVKRTFAPS